MVVHSLVAHTVGVKGRIQWVWLKFIFPLGIKFDHFLIAIFRYCLHNLLPVSSCLGPNLLPTYFLGNEFISGDVASDVPFSATHACYLLRVLRLAIEVRMVCLVLA